MQIPEKVDYIIRKLKKNGHEGYAVGGCVRDRILGREPGDWDITTSAKPDEVKQIFTRTIDTGIQHGTVTVMVDGEGFEVTTYRVDGDYEDHRHPTSVEFTPNLEEDLKRRDFTINAMAYNPHVGMVDLFDGMGDIERRCIRCVGEPRERFSEDALRMLRGVRFAGQLGFEVEDKTLCAMKELAPTIQNVSAERIRVELTKLLLSNTPERLMLAEQTGLCNEFLPEFSEMLRTEQNNPHHCYNVGEHSLWAVRHVQELYRCVAKDTRRDLNPYDAEESMDKVNTILVYAALLHDVGKPSHRKTDENGIDHFYGHDVAGSEMVYDILRRLRFDNDTVGMVSKLVRFHERRYDGRKKTLRRLVSQVGKDAMPYLFLLQEADIRSQSDYEREDKLTRLKEAKEMYLELLEKEEPVSIKELAVTGNDLIGIGVKPGPQIGEILRQLLEIVIENPTKNNKQTLLTEAQKRITIVGR